MASTPLSSADGNTALTPLPAGERLFGWRDHAALWLSLGVGLLVMQIGAYLVPALGTQAALTVIICGSILGAGSGRLHGACNSLISLSFTKKHFLKIAIKINNLRI